MAVLLLHGRHGAYKRINTITNNLIIGGPIYSSLSIVVGKEKKTWDLCVQGLVQCLHHQRCCTGAANQDFLECTSSFIEKLHPIFTKKSLISPKNRLDDTTVYYAVVRRGGIIEKRASAVVPRNLFQVQSPMMQKQQ